MHIKDHSAAMKFFRTYDSAASKGKWKEFVDEMEFDSMLQEPRTMAQAPIAEDLDPGALRDEMLKGFDPSQETHEEYLQRINLERPFNAAQGGSAGQLVAPSVDGSRPGYNGDKYRRGYPLKKGAKFKEGFKWALQQEGETGTDYFKTKKEMTDVIDAKVKKRKTLSKVPAKSELNKAAAYYNSLPKDHPLYISSSSYDDLTWIGREKKRVYERLVEKGGKFTSKTPQSAFSKTDQAKILKHYPDAKFTPQNTYGFSPANDAKKYDEVWRFVNERNFQKSYKKLPKYAQKQLEDAFPSVNFDWERKSRFGVTTNLHKTDPNLYKKIQTYLDDPKQWRHAFDLRSADGWMTSQIDRAALQGNEQYESLTEKFTVTDKKGKTKRVDKVVGVKDGNKIYWPNEELRKKYGKPRDLLIRNHDDFANTKKYWNIADKTSKKYLSEYDNLAKLLPEGFDPKKIQVNDLLQFIGDKDGIKGLNRAKRAIQLHHEYGVGTRATKNYQLLTEDMNLLAEKTNKLLKSKKYTHGANLEAGAAQALKDETRLVVDDVRYGPKKVSETGDIKKIISQAESELKNFTKKDFKTFKDQLKKLGCGMYAGGRVGFKVGSGQCITRGLEKLKNGSNLKGVEKKLANSITDQVKKVTGKRFNWKTFAKGEGYFVAADVINNWTKGQSFWKGLGKGIEVGTFGLADFNTDERALLSKGKKLVDQGVITQQEFDSMESWLKYTEALKNRRATQEGLFSAAEDLKENEELTGGKNILEGEAAGWNTLEAGVEAGVEESDIADKNLNQIVDTYNSITDEGSMGYDTMSKVMDHLVGEEWSKPAGTIFDRGNRRNQGEGKIWGPIGGVITDVWNLAASPWQGLKDSNTIEQMKMNVGLKETTPQERIMEHPVHGFEEAKLKHPEAWEDIAYDMDYAINPTEQLWKAEGGIMSLKKKW